MYGEFHEPPSSTLDGPCRSLNATYPVVVVPSRFHFTITSPTTDLGNLRRGAMSLTDFLLTWQPITSPRSVTELHNLPMLVVLLSNEQHSPSPSPSHFTTDGRSVRLSWCRAPISYFLTVSVLSWGGRPLWREGGSVLSASFYTAKCGWSDI
jgi:hypothetical protein